MVILHPDNIDLTGWPIGAELENKLPVGIFSCGERRGGFAGGASGISRAWSAETRRRNPLGQDKVCCGRRELGFAWRGEAGVAKVLMTSGTIEST